MGSPGAHRLAARIGLFAGPIVAILVAFLLPDAARDEAGKVVSGFTFAGKATLGVGVLMGIWWLSEAIPLEATGLLPLVLFPILGVASIKDAAAPFSDGVIYLFLGGMLLGRAMEHCGLHLRIALAVIAAFGTRPNRLVLGLLCATGFLSLWVSNTTAAMMMIPIATSVSNLVREQLERRHQAAAHASAGAFSASCVLAVAYGASIGGVGTIIGTPPVTQFVGYMHTTHAVRITFVDWLPVGLPVAVVAMLAAWLVLTRLAIPLRIPRVEGLDEVITMQRRELGRMSPAERRTAMVFLAAAIAWIAVPLLARAPFVRENLLVLGSFRLDIAPVLDRLGDPVIAIAAAMILFVLPAGPRSLKSGESAPRLLSWREAQDVPWGILLLFGGGLSLAAAISAHGVDRAIAAGAGAFASLPLFWLLLVFSLSATFLSEFMNNTALAAILLQIAGPIAVRIGAPVQAVLIVGVLGASLAFMLPAGTAPNAIAFASRGCTSRQMARAGLWLNLALGSVNAALVYALHHAGLLPG